MYVYTSFCAVCMFVLSEFLLACFCFCVYLFVIDYECDRVQVITCVCVFVCVCDCLCVFDECMYVYICAFSFAKV